MSSSLAHARTQPGAEPVVLDLIQRLEAATEGGRELDGEIDALLFGGRAAHLFDRDAVGGVRVSYGAGTVFHDADQSINGGYVLSDMFRKAAPYTTSLDAALALAERVLGDDWSFSAIRVTPTKAEAYAWPYRDHMRQSSASAPTTALALCIAILKATPPLSDRTGGEK